MVDTYTDHFIPYTDAKVTADIFKGVPTKYAPKGGSILSDYWILENTVPNIGKFCGKEVALILALPLLWSILHETKSHFVSPFFTRTTGW